MERPSGIEPDNNGFAGRPLYRMGRGAKLTNYRELNNSVAKIAMSSARSVSAVRSSCRNSIMFRRASQWASVIVSGQQNPNHMSLVCVAHISTIGVIAGLGKLLRELAPVHLTALLPVGGRLGSAGTVMSPAVTAYVGEPQVI